MSQSTATTVDTVSGESRQRLLEENVLLLAPSFGYWMGMYQLPKDKLTIEIDDEDISDSSITTPRARLLTDKYPLDSSGKPWAKRFTALRSRMRATVDRYSIPFPINGVRIVPKVSGNDFLRAIDDIRRDMADATDEFVADLAGVMEQIKRNTDVTIWDAIQKKVPRERNVMRGKFYIDVCPIELAGGRTAAVGLAELSAHADLVREATQRKVDEAIESIVAVPRAELARAISELQKLIERDGQVKSNSFNAVNAAIAKLKSFSFLSNREIMDGIQQLERRIQTIDPAALNSTVAASNGFTSLLNKVMTEATDAVKQAQVAAAFGNRSLRAVEL